MATTVESRMEAIGHAAAMERAADYFAAAARRGDLAVSPKEFDARLKAFFESLHTRLDASNALVLAVLEDQPCPLDFFKAWASPGQIWLWRRAENDPLPSITRNRKVLVKPRDFFRALDVHGKNPGKDPQ